MSSESEEEDFVAYGTPLDPLNEDEIPKKRAVTVEDQVAKDKHGRRRFHGAFTGGFSAGFFNSVGSLEGWKPTQFTSSRADRSKAQVQRAEDFMDDEDMDEFGIAPKVLQPRANYKQANESTGRKRSLMQFSEGPIPGVPVLKTLIEPVRETIGIKMLMKMGWKSGQGVGPRLTKSEKSTWKKNQKAVKIYGCSLPTQEGQSAAASEEVSEEEDDVPEDVTFAPDDYEPYIVKPKDNCFGLGYSGLDRRPVLSSHINLFAPAGPSLVMEEKKKKVSIRGQAFGVGAFENEDEDIYAKEDMSQYDFALDTPKMLAEKRKQERNTRLALPPSSSDVLEGFVKTSKPVVQKAYPPPLLPQGFRPLHCTKPSRFSAVAGGAVQTHSRLTANERAVLVNTEPPPQDRPTPQEEKVLLAAPQEDVERVTGGFRPFLADPDKQDRYEKFLTLSKLGQSDKLRSLQPLTMTEWEAERERGEFEQASRLYRPLSAAFSDRFVSASQPDDATDPLAPVARTAGVDQDVVEAAKRKMFGRLTRRISEWQPHSTLCKRFNIPPPGRSNGSASMSAKTSRPKFSIFNFLDAAPFNAPLTGNVDLNTIDAVPPTSKSDVATPHDTEDRVQEAVNKDDEIDKLAESTNKMDLYKAIFLSSSDESDGEDGKQKSTVNSTDESSTVRNNSPPRGIFANLESLHSQPAKALSVEHSGKAAKEENILRNNSPPRGIFANLDLINNLTKTSQQSSLHSNEALPAKGSSVIGTNKRVGNINVDGQQLNTDRSNEESRTAEIAMYGPPLPQTTLQTRLKANVNIDSSSDSGEWVEQDDSDSSDVSNKNHRNTSKKKQKRTHKKSKKHKEKKKHKHKKKKSK